MDRGFFVMMALLASLAAIALIPRLRSYAAAALRLIAGWQRRCLMAGLAACCHVLWEKERSGAAKLNPPRQRYQR